MRGGRLRRMRRKRVMEGEIGCGMMECGGGGGWVRCNSLILTGFEA